MPHEIDVEAETLAHAHRRGCYCITTAKRCTFHEGYEDGMYHALRMADPQEQLFTA